MERSTHALSIELSHLFYDKTVKRNALTSLYYVLLAHCSKSDLYSILYYTYRPYTQMIQPAFSTARF